MVARDSNGATWYVLRYPPDFTPRPVDPLADPAPPELDPTLLYDDARGVLELRPCPPVREVSPLPGLALTVEGEVLRVDPQTGTLFRVLCDGSQQIFPCEPRVLAGPRGLAVDRRGFLYVADARAHRVVVLDLSDGTVQAILDGGALTEPVDVAVAPNGMIYVADRAGGKIVVYKSLRAAPVSFVPQDEEGLPIAPRPIAVMIDPSAADPGCDCGDNILVADAAHPRLLGFDAGGTPRPDRELSALLGDLRMRGAAEILENPAKLFTDSASAPWPSGECGEMAPAAARVSGPATASLVPALLTLRQVALRCSLLGWPVSAPDPRVLATAPFPRTLLAAACCPPRPANEAGARLALWHAVLRLLRLALARSYEASGVYISAALDSGTLGTQWHRIEVDAELPEGASLTVETASGNTPFATAAATWTAPHDQGGALIPITAEVPEQLIQSPPGRFLRLRVSLSSNGEATPSVRAIRVLYPRVSYLDLLPRVYRRDPDAAKFLEHFLALFERIFTGVEDRWVEFSSELNPDAAPREVIDWLACLVDLSFDPSWPLEKRRALVSGAIELYRIRGTVEGIKRYVEIYTGKKPEVLEAFLSRPASPPFLGRAGAVLGCSMRAMSGRDRLASTGGSALPSRDPMARPSDVPPLQASFEAHAHRFTVLVYVDDPCDEEVIIPVVDRIVSVNKPAHTAHELRLIRPDARVGLQSAVGLDLVLGTGQIIGPPRGERRPGLLLRSGVEGAS